jgi:hypothetical protein
MVAGYDVLYSHPNSSSFFASCISMTVAMSITRLRLKDGDLNHSCESI